MKSKIKKLRNQLVGLDNDARLWDLSRTYGEYSLEVLRHLESCQQTQAAERNHT